LYFLNSIGSLIAVEEYQGLAYLSICNFTRVGDIYPGKAYQVKTDNEDFLYYLSNSESYQYLFLIR